MSEVSAKAGQFIVFTYSDDLPSRLYSADHVWKREVTMPTDQAVDLYNQLRSALYD